MKSIVVNIGSNSVKILKMIDGVITKRSYTTRLEEGSGDGLLKSEPIARTLEAISSVDYREYDDVFAFATEAVRSRRNGVEFAKTVREIVGVDVDILSGEQEADIGYIGASRGRDAVVVDVGGASTEIAYGEGKSSFRVSLPLGAVRILDMCGEDEDKIMTEVLKRTEDINVPCDKTMVLIGGTATTLTALIQDIKTYDKSVVDGMSISVDEVEMLCERLKPMSVKERRDRYPLLGKRAEVIVSGGRLLVGVMRRLGYTSATVSDTDATEGYLLNKLSQRAT